MISIELSRRFKKIVREAGREAEVAAALQLILAGFGNPHAHTGLAWRLVFEAQKGVLTFDFAGDHDEVQNYLRGQS